MLHFIPATRSQALRFFQNALIGTAFLGCALLTSSTLHADRFVFIDETGEKKEVVGRLHGSGQGAYAIEQRDGSMEVIAQGAVIERDNTVDWTPFTTDEMVDQLTERFTPDLFRSYVDDNFVIGMVLMAPLDRTAEGPANGFLRKAAQFMNNVNNVFSSFARDMRLDTRDPDTPLVLLIFESDSDFNDYAASVTKGQGLSVSSISGFYDGMTNYLAIRMAECATFEVPLHEAIHQQVYNRGILQRLAPIPSWFNEGIATGFEANKDRIQSGPAKVHSRYAAQVSSVEQVSWEDLISQDLAFQGDVMAGDAYCLAWCLHWLLVTERPEKYTEYVKMLGEKAPLAKEDDATRTAEFVEHFGDDFQQLRQDFNLALRNAMRRQRNTREPPQKPGYLNAQRGLAEIELTALNRQDRGGLLEVQGRIRNMNPLRSLTFAVSIVTDGNTYAQWILPSVGSSRVVPLTKQYAQDQIPGTTPQPSNSFRVHIQAVLPDSPEAQQWLRGQGPDPREG
ncbi:DUF1570 domain-containing protein [Rubinisphaera margarita]|uniref:DUF1570 domain-containing protein n=1 Tax=Rubinisphaera margarita TaxID=2909586 RepID=UPI001EE784F0|nr:DUF1570 domain-containing protein [Rubinisphaera margarita]MCG6157893.1 DUF1570 domain-containing protein [Rubinisphaera margarita]